VDIVKVELVEIRITAVQLDGADVRIAFPSSAGKSYRLERNDNLSGTEWETVLPNIPGTGGTVEVTDTMAGRPLGFYRIRLLP
jgi:hypothetical protein